MLSPVAGPSHQTKNITAINVTKEKGNHHSDHHTFQIISCYWVQSNEYTAYGFQILFNLNLHLKQQKVISDFLAATFSLASAFYQLSNTSLSWFSHDLAITKSIYLRSHNF